MGGRMEWFDELMDSGGPEVREAFEGARRELDAAWEVTCRYGNCTVFVKGVDPVTGRCPSMEDADMGGWGSVGCPCEGENEYACHLCGHELVGPWQKCPECGARMGDK